MSAGAIQPVDPDQTVAPPDVSSAIDQSAAPATAPPPAAAGAAIPGPTAQMTRGTTTIPNPISQGAGANGKPQIQTGPPTPPQFDPKKLSKAQTTLDILNAMKPASRTDYMDWWQKQHGDINDRYDNLQQSLGQRPTDNGLSRKEKFAALLEFGLHLMQNSAKPSTNQGGVLAGTLADSVDQTQKQHQQGIQQSQSDYDTQQQALETDRQKALGQLGTPSAAQQAQTQANVAPTTELKNNASAYKDIAGATQAKTAALGQPTYVTGQDGSLLALTRDPDSGKVETQQVTDIDGKPLKGRVLGKSTGSGIDKGDTSQIRNQKYLTSVLGLDADTATKIAFHAKSGNPQADHMAIYKAVLSSTLGDADKAKQAADQYVLSEYGAAGLNPQSTQIVPKPPSAYDFSKLKPGQQARYPDGSVWTIGIDGKPARVQTGASPSVQ